MRNLIAKTGKIIGVRPYHTDADWRMLYLQQMLHNCTLYQTPFYEKHGWCGTPAEHLHRFNTTECDRKQLRNGLSQQAICRYRKTTVIKVIRLKYLGNLLKIKNIKSADIKIIHLLRHPAALMTSRKTNKHFFIWDEKTILEANKKSQRRVKAAWEAYNYCDDHLKSIAFIEKDPWFRDRYMRITHRDISLKPVEITEKVYDFIGEPMPDYMREHIFNLTGAQSEGYQHRKNESLNLYRNSSEVITNWKTMPLRRVKYWDVVSIEEQCKLLFKHLAQPFVADATPRNFESILASPLADIFDYF